MAGKKIAYEIDVNSSKGVQGLKQFSSAVKREMKSVDDELDDTATAGERVAQALSQMATKLDTELTEAARAADALKAAMGDVGERADVGSIVADLNRMGLTFDEITADADKLADSLKQLDGVQVKAIDSGLQNVDTSLGKVGASADNSRSVLANMVGNSVQDLGALGGVAGSAGVALGQLGEYASEGNIGLAGLAKVAGPMLALAVATELLSGYMKSIADSKAFEQKRVKDFTVALDDAKLTAEELQDILNEDEEHALFARVGTETKDVERSVGALFGTLENFNDEVAKGIDGYDAWAASLVRDAEAAGATGRQIDQLKTLLAEARDGAISNTVATAAQANGFGVVADAAVAYASSIRGVGEGLNETAFDQQFYTETTEEAAGSTKSATQIIQEQIDKQLGQKQKKEFDAAREGIEAYDEAIASTDFGAVDLQGGLTAMSAFTDQFNSLNTLAVDYEEAVAGITEAVKENGFTFDLATEAGRNNQEALEGVADTLDVRLAAAYANADGDMQTFKDSANQIGLETLGRLQEEMGLSAEETDELARKLGLLPEDIETRYEMSGVEEAKLKLDLLQGSIDLLPRDVQTRVTQQIIAGDYVGALATVETYYANHPADMPTKVKDPDNKETVRNDVQGWFNGRPINIGARVSAPIAVDAGGVVPAGGGIAAEIGPEFAVLPSGQKVLLTQPSLVPAGTRVTSRRETARILRTRPHFDNGTGGVAPVNVNVRVDTGGVFSNEFAFARLVRRAVNDGVRLAGSRT